MPRKRRVDPLQQSLFVLEPAVNRGVTSLPANARPYDHSYLLLGTCAFNAAGWAGSFYQPGMKPSQYISHYATKFKTVETKLESAPTLLTN